MWKKLTEGTYFAYNWQFNRAPGVGGPMNKPRGKIGGQNAEKSRHQNGAQYFQSYMRQDEHEIHSHKSETDDHADPFLDSFSCN